MARTALVPVPSIAPSPSPARVHVLSRCGLPALAAELGARGADVEAHEDLPALLASIEEGAPARLVVAVDADRSRDLLAAAAALRRLHAAVPLVLLLEETAPCPAWRKAASLTAACFPAALEAATLAHLIVEGVAPAQAAPVAATQPVPVPRHVVLTLWESFAVDDRQVYLGVCERNFLFTLAQRPGVRLAKSAPVEAGPGRHLPASSCRRRLGQRLGPELAELLVPQERFEPYRLREPAEVEAISSRRGHGRVTMRIVGRASVRMVQGAFG